jgi:hypothetical protein
LRKLWILYAVFTATLCNMEALRRHIKNIPAAGAALNSGLIVLSRWERLWASAGASHAASGGIPGDAVGDQIEITVRIRVFEPLQQRKVARGIACGRGLRQRLSLLRAQRAVDPNLVWTAIIVQGRFDTVATRRPARSQWEIALGYGAEFVDAEDRRLSWWLGVECDDPCPVGMKSGSLLLAHSRVRRQRTPSCAKMRRTCLRAARLPRYWAASVKVSSVHSLSPSGSSVSSSPDRS